MAKKRVVTRTIVTTQVTVLCVDLESQQTYNQTFSINDNMKDEKKILKLIKSEHETDNLKIVSIVEIEHAKTLYGMDENEFVENAYIMQDEQEKRERYKANKEKTN